MGIHYATGTAADAHAWLNAVRTFAVNILGWTEDTWSTGSGTSRLHLHNAAGEYVALYLAPKTILGWTNTLACGVSGATGYNSALAWDAQPGASPAASNPYATALEGTNLPYHLFGGTGTDGSYCHAVVLTAPGAVASIHFGSLAKCATYNGGAFVDAMGRFKDAHLNSSFRQGLHCAPFCFSVGSQIPKGGVRADLDGAAAPKWWRLPNQAMSATSSTLAASPIQIIGELTVFDGWLTVCSPSQLNGRTVLWPIPIVAPRPGGYWSLLGTVPGIRFLSMELLTSGEEITLGSEVWQVWPAWRKGLGWAYETAADSTLWLGYAYRKS